MLLYCLFSVPVHPQYSPVYPNALVIKHNIVSSILEAFCKWARTTFQTDELRQSGIVA